jgi:hypothetical protein
MTAAYVELERVDRAGAGGNVAGGDGSIWHAGKRDNPFGQRLTALMISKHIVDTAVPMSLLADHPNVQFNYFRGGIGTCEVEMH